ncbi:MAG: cell division protein FtsL [Deltaproteobacteria bacterium]|nr:cell division protein FtsL [Deltaproteobacteria bacterium]
MNTAIPIQPRFFDIIRESPIIKSRRKWRRAVLPMAAFILFSGSLLLITFVHLNVFIQGYAVGKLEQKQDGLLKALQALRLEEAVLKRPDRIRKIAREELGLIPASKAPVIRMP